MTTEHFDQTDLADPPGNGRRGIEGILQEPDLPRPRRRLPTQSILLVILLGASAGALYAMRQYGMKSGFKFESVAVDYTEADSERARTYERIMIDLARIQQPLDVALGEFDKSPFMQRPKANSVNPDVDPIPLDQPTEHERHIAEAVAKLKMMRVNSIVGPIARIDGQNVRVGDIVDIFTVTAISGRTVTFVAYDQEFTLTIETGGPGAGPHRTAPTTRMRNSLSGQR